MAHMDTLIVTFQTQLSDVMEAVVKTAMYEVTRLVEDSLLEELKARSQEVETLRIQLQWAERKLSEQGAKEAGRKGKCADSVKDEGETPKEANPDILEGDHAVNDIDSVDSHRHVIKSGPMHEQDEPAASFSPVWKSQAKADDHVKLVEDIKEEAVVLPSCSSLNLEEWRVTLGDAGPDCQNGSVMTDAEEKLTQESNKELLRHIIQLELDPQLSTAYVTSNGQKDTNNAPSTNHVRSLEMNSSWLQMDIPSEKDCKAQSSQRDSLKECVTPNAPVIPGSPKQNIFGVAIKQEVIVDPEQAEEEMHTENKTTSYSEQTTFPKVHIVRTGTPKQNRFSHKPSVHILKSKVSTVFRPNVALQHVQRAAKRPQTSLSNSSTTTTLTVPHSQAVSSAHRHPSTSKAPPSLPLSVPRAQLGDKHAVNRSGAPWINIKSQQSSNSCHTNPSLHIDAHLHAGPRQILRCGQCGKCFPHPSNLKSHLQTHTGERPFCCSLCGRSFTKLSNLKAHRRVHTGERPYSCLSCGKRFTQKCNLKRHQRIHIEG